ncbi:MAG: aldehyde ferredoxin oxidoreductase family protein [Candidatus Nezhaarchaeota archaeon]|nr:aldehyde ferredoxin oxidoreductase family protein [Candidatus Nezhaarchaeota archaeon]
MFGYAGSILRIDLTSRRIVKQALPLEWGARFIGGSGVNDWILWNEVGPEVDPLGPDNELIFGVGPLAGTILPLGCKVRVTTRSPLTGIFGDSGAGGFWASELKFAGYDHLVIRGRSPKPVYVFIDDEEVEVRDASHLWGCDVYEAEERLKKELGKDVRVACIGPAGENLVKFAAILFDKYRAAAKTGVGCVMGSKRLKAIVVRGSKKIEVADPKTVSEIAQELRQSLTTPGVQGWAKYGTTNLCIFYNQIGCHSVRNYQDVVAPKISEFPDTFIEKYATGKVSCSYGCVVACTHPWRIEEGRYAGEEGGKVDYIVICSLGIHLGIYEVDSILHLQNLVNKLGLDATETGTLIGLLMELQQRGLLPREIGEGLLYEWGDPMTVEETVWKIAFRKGAGDVFAEGTVYTARRLNAEKYICHSKGLTEVEDVRGFPHWALAYAISTRGADHLKAHCQIDKQQRTDTSLRLFGAPDVGYPVSTSLKARSVKYHEDFNAVINSLGVCHFPALSLMLKRPERALYMEDYAKIFSAVTGIKMTPGEIAKCGERIVCLEKSFNARLGVSRKDDTLHGKWMYEPCPSGLGKGMKCEDYLEKLLDEYYAERGFDVKTGLPTVRKLRQLGLDEVAQELVNRRIIDW